MPGTVLAAIDRYEVSVKGLACPFCAFGIEKKIKALPGVHDVHVDLEGGTVTFEVAGDDALTPPAVRKAVKQTGFSTGTIRVTASGRIEGTGTERRLRLDADDALDLRSSPETEALLDDAGRREARVWVTGSVTRETKRDVLLVESLREEGK